MSSLCLSCFSAGQAENAACLSTVTSRNGRPSIRPRKSTTTSDDAANGGAGPATSAQDVQNGGRRVTLLTTMTDDQTRSRFRWLPRGIEENYFKPVPGGWLVAVKRPHGSNWNHVVSDAQKPIIAARLRLAIVARFTLFAGWFLVAIIGAGRSETPLVIFGLLLAFNA